MELEISATDFRKISNIKFYKNPSSWRRVVPFGRTDKHDEANSRFSHFASRLKMIVLVSNFVHEVISIFQRDVVENSLFWDIAQRVAVIPYRRFGTTYRSHLQGSRIQEYWILEDDTDRMSRNVGKELPLLAT
jgi:hypothetical protein